MSLVPRPASQEFGVIVARCAECGASGVVGTDLGARDYEKGEFVVPRAVCLSHLAADDAAAAAARGDAARP